MAAGLLALGPLVDGTDAPLNAPALPPCFRVVQGPISQTLRHLFDRDEHHLNEFAESVVRKLVDVE